jgi:hypothetical protein
MATRTAGDVLVDTLIDWGRRHRVRHPGRRHQRPHRVGAHAQGQGAFHPDYEVVPSGCCGMAGSFGFEAEKYDMSIAAAERVLLPRLRAIPEDTLVLANGFSCREQIEQCTGRRTVHVAEAVARRRE